MAQSVHRDPLVHEALNGLYSPSRGNERHLFTTEEACAHQLSYEARTDLFSSTDDKAYKKALALLEPRLVSVERRENRAATYFKSLHELNQLIPKNTTDLIQLVKDSTRSFGEKASAFGSFIVGISLIALIDLVSVISLPILGIIALVDSLILELEASSLEKKLKTAIEEKKEYLEAFKKAFILAICGEKKVNFDLERSSAEGSAPVAQRKDLMIRQDTMLDGLQEALNNDLFSTFRDSSVVFGQLRRAGEDPEIFDGKFYVAIAMKDKDTNNIFALPILLESNAEVSLGQSDIQNGRLFLKAPRELMQTQVKPREYFGNLLWRDILDPHTVQESTKLTALHEVISGTHPRFQLASREGVDSRASISIMEGAAGALSAGQGRRGKRPEGLPRLDFSRLEE